MLTRPQVTALLALAFLISAVVAKVEGEKLPFAVLFSTLSGAVSAMMLVLVAVELWLWKLPLFYPWLFSKPDIGGRWEGELRSLWKNPATGVTPPPIPVEVVVHQTYPHVNLALATAESRSDLLAADLRYNSSGSHSLAAVYLNIPRLPVRDRSPIHHGAMILRFDGRRPTEMRGDYWTDRDSLGELVLTRVEGPPKPPPR